MGLDNRPVIWLNYPFASSDAGSAAPPALSVAAGIIRQIVEPALRGMSPARFKPLAALLDSLTREVTTTHTPAPAQPVAISRRNLLTGRIGRPATAPEPITSVSRRVIPPAVRYALSLALLKTVAWEQNRLPAEVLAHEYGLSLSQKSPRLLAAFNALTPRHVEQTHQYQPAAFGFTLPQSAGAAELGPQAETLQNRLREAGDFLRAATPTAYRPAILLNAQGRPGALFNDDAGKILGALYGMQHVTAPCALIVCDPVIKDSLSAQINWLKELKSYLRFRKMAVTLAAGAWMRSAADVHALADAGAAEAILLDMPRLGSLHQAMEMALAARQRGLKTLAAGAPSPPLDDTIRLNAQIGLTIRPDYLVISAESPAVLGLGLAQTNAACAQVISMQRTV